MNGATMPESNLSVALVHERFTEFAGSEAVVEQLANAWPNAPIFSPLARRNVLPPELETRLRPSRLSRLLTKTSYAHLLPAIPVSMRRMDLPDCDVVIASHHAFSNQVVYATDAPVISYVHSPARWVWDKNMRIGEVGGWPGRVSLSAFSAAYRPLDIKAARRVQVLVANSNAVARRIEDWWERESTVVHPPVNTDFYTPDPTTERESFFLLAGRLVSYKRPDLAIRAARRAGVPLVVAGTGRARPAMEAIAGPLTTFIGRVSDDALRDLYRRCAALLMPGVEDFGIVPVEAQACGAPVIATDDGGVRDSVLDGITGSLIRSDKGEQVEVWSRALKDYDADKFAPSVIRAHAEQFSRSNFIDKMKTLVHDQPHSPRTEPKLDVNDE